MRTQKKSKSMRKTAMGRAGEDHAGQFGQLAAADHGQESTMIGCTRRARPWKGGVQYSRNSQNAYA